MTFVHGKHTGERMVIEECEARPIPLNTVVSHGKSCRVTLPPHNGFRVIVSAYQSCYAGALSKSDASELRRLGFVWNYVDEGIPSVAGDCAMPNAVLRESLNDETASHKKGEIPSGHQVPAVYDRVLIKYCCGPTIRLGRDGPSTKGCARYRLTRDEDMTTPEGLRLALDLVESAQRACPGRLMLWASIPCTGEVPGRGSLGDILAHGSAWSVTYLSSGLCGPTSL